MSVWIHVCASVFSLFNIFLFFFFFFFLSCSCWLFFREQYTSVGPVYYLRDPQISLFNNFLLKMGPMALFIYLNIILLQCFQFSVFIKISYIQTDLMYSFGYWWKSSVLHLRFLLLFFFLDAHFCGCDVFPVGLVHCSQDLQTSFLLKLSLKMDLTALFTYLKIILLQCFQFLVSVFSKISYI